MSEVHHAITAHSKKQHAIVKRFIELDQKREMYIEEAVSLCQNGKPFSVERINEVTKLINELSKTGIVPQRKYVTIEMVQQYVKKLKGEEGTVQ
ncbi:uncharacterized protein DUF2533 [Thermolongibacillus altinsuensis]|jgi:hypothetical protein|uniref:Uncharacterized protein DUF2533 n=1 Tax=Thermolongibacillus altinsuensis TaxID=575256 RepID=A0A4R1QHS4_9BACL|nr:YpbS family protein [Thermolongibacillus altinsuensis]TCL49749.1 uncharacterized protein DUF2533 [Thermolongibacillus altinsuensis]GMB08308.1 hypothetical protein B1no1_10180 [Thermolongibacillus altinsuensis]